MYSYYFTICSLCFSFLLLFAYFSKKRVKRAENVFYSGVVISSFIGLLFECCLWYLFFHNHITQYSFEYHFLVKAIYLIYLFGVSFTVLYFVCLLFISKGKRVLGVQLMLASMSVINVLTLFLPLETTMANGVIVPLGPFIITADFIGITYILIMLIFAFIYRDVINPRERIPLIFTLIFFFADVYLQLYGILFLTHSMSNFVAFIMYFTIQNPDYKMLEQVKIAKDRADKANKAKSEFLSSMSHEIRTPLNAIVGFSEGLKEENLASDAKEAVNDIISASQTLLETVNGILDISKIEANKIEIINVTYDFDEVFSDLVALSKARLGNEKPIEFRYHKSENIPKYLYGDSTRLKQIIINLLTNAVKYTKEGYILFDVSCINSDNNCKLIISVEDTGMGIKEENLNKLFSKFERLDNENSGIEGTGLGLAITKKLVELMNGKIDVRSKFGEGSTFTVVVDQKVSTKPNKNEEKVIDNITIEHDLSNKKVLVVDDNELNLKVAKNMLKAYSIEPVQIKSGIECLNLIKQGNIYDLILLDDMMPEKNGKETFKELKEIPNFNIPVVILTANAIEGMKEEYLSLGFNDYLAKPIDREELKSIIDKYLDK